MSLNGPWKQHIAKVTTADEDVRLFHIDCPSAQPNEKSVILLIHDFPETSCQFWHVLKPLSGAGYCLVVPDTTGHGNSSHPPHSYTKHYLPTICTASFKNHLYIAKPIYVVGHDIGGMFAHAFAVRYPSYTKVVIWASVRFLELPFTRTTKDRGSYSTSDSNRRSILQSISSREKKSSLSSISMTGSDIMRMEFLQMRLTIMQ
jgi:pimeloyl-ACP methyl ester carboxylesterase